MKRSTLRMKLNTYKRYIRKYKRLIINAPASEKLKWLKKRILKLSRYFEDLLANQNLKARRIASAACIGLFTTMNLSGQSFEYIPPIAHPFEGIDQTLGSTELKFVDFDSDGDDDILVSFYHDAYYSDVINGESFRYYENTEEGYIEVDLAVPDNLGIPSGSQVDGRINFAVVDMDADGDLDLIVKDTEAPSYHYLKNNEGTFESNMDENPFLGLNLIEPSFFDIGDIDGDDSLEAVIEVNGALRLYKLNGEGKFEFSSDIGDVDFATVNLNDYDADGDLDLVVGNKYGDITIYENIAGTFTELEGQPLASLNRNTQITTAFSDIDGDGDQDLITGTATGAIMYYENVEGSYTYVPYNPYGIDFQGGELNVSDFEDIDGDGDLDLVYGTWVRSVNFLERDGDEFIPDLFKFQVLFDEDVAVLQSHPECADWDNDGDIDCIVSSDFGPEIIPLENVDGAFVLQDSLTSPFYSLRPDDEAKSFAFEDFDNDGDLDVFIGNKYGQLHYFVNNEGVYEETNFSLSDFQLEGYTDPIFADLDADGDNDLVMLDGYGRLFYFIKDGDELLASEVNPFPDLPEDTYNIAFYDREGDGDLDALVSTFSGRALYFQNNDLESSVKDMVSASEVTVFPNPTANQVIIQLDEKLGDVVEEIKIFDIDSRLLETINYNSNNLVLSLADYRNGNYILRINTSSEVIVKKISVAR